MHPKWRCGSNDVEVSVGNQPYRPLVDGRYLRIGWLNPGDQVTLTFPVPERTIHRVIGEIPYKLTLRGFDVVAIDPKGIALPLYENRSTGKLLQKTRFVPELSGIIW